MTLRGDRDYRVSRGGQSTLELILGDLLCWKLTKEQKSPLWRLNSISSNK